MNHIHLIKIACVVFCIFIFKNASSSADNIKFEHLGVDEGLSQQVVQAIYQDSVGFLWIGTQEGLNRYDGFEFRPYMPDAWVRSISEDIYGNLWVGTTDGVNILNKDSTDFKRIKNNPEEKAHIVGTTVFGVWRDKSNNMWAFTRKALNRYNESDQTFTHFIPNFDGDNKLLMAAYQDMDYGTWLSANTDSLHFIPNDTESMLEIDITFESINIEENSANNVSVSFMFIDSKRRIWLATASHGIFVSEDALLKMPALPEQIRFKKFSSTINSAVETIIEDNDGTIWFGSITDGLYYLTQDGQLGHLEENPSQPRGLSSDTVNDIIEDSNGVLWVGTFSGLNKWNTAHKRFDLLKVEEDKSRSLIGPNITAIDSMNGKVFISSYDGLSILDVNTGNIKNLTADGLPTGLLEDPVMSLEVVSDNEVWLGYRSKGASKLNPTTGEIEHFVAERSVPGKLQSGSITSILQTRDGTVWLTTFGGGLHKYDDATGEFVNYTTDENNEFSFKSSRMISITEDNQGLLWIGAFNDGVNVFNRSSESVYRLGSDNVGQEELVTATPWVIHEDNLGNIWIGTQGDGLKYIKGEDYAKGDFKAQSITRDDGLPSNVVYGILEDDKGHLWISTNRGLAQLTISTKEMVTYTEAHGLLSREFNSNAYHVAEDGKFYFGGTIGVTSFYPESIKPSTYSPPIEITSVQVLNDFYSVTDLQGNDGVIEFTHEDYLIGFEFASLDFVAPKDNKYKYKLRGFDSDWVNAVGTRRATYTNLPSGAYEFTVIATNSDGVWNELGQSVSIVVHPPPWRSPYANVIYAILAGALLIMGYIYFSNKSDSQRRYREKLEEEVSQRTNELQIANEQLLHASVTDQLTGLHNRRYLLDIMPESMKELMIKFEFAAEAGELTLFSGPRLFFLTFDMDGFKPINDNYGHDAGDKVIVQVGDILKQLTRFDDIVTRWGGDEFLIVGEVNSIDEVKTLAETIRARIADNPFDIGLEKPVRLTSSLGFSMYPFCIRKPNALSWEQVHLLADKALYKSKQSGRNTWTGVVRTETGEAIEAFGAAKVNIDDAVNEGLITLHRYEPEIFKSSSIIV